MNTAKKVKGFRLSKTTINALDSASKITGTDRSVIAEEALKLFIPKLLQNHKVSVQKLNDSVNHSTM